MNKLYRQEKLVEKLVKYRLRKYDFKMIKVEAYDTFESDKYMCRVECFQNDIGIKGRVLKYESELNPTYVQRLENIVREKYDLNH